MTDPSHIRLNFPRSMFNVNLTSKIMMPPPKKFFPSAAALTAV
jgi:hypothetical protein